MVFQHHFSRCFHGISPVIPAWQVDAADHCTAEALCWAVQKETDRGSATGMSQRRVKGNWLGLWYNVGPKKDSVQLGRL